MKIKTEPRQFTCFSEKACCPGQFVIRIGSVRPGDIPSGDAMGGTDLICITTSVKGIGVSGEHRYICTAHIAFTRHADIIPLPLRNLEHSHVIVAGERHLVVGIVAFIVFRFVGLDTIVPRYASCRNLAHKQEMLAVIIALDASGERIGTVVIQPISGFQVADHVIWRRIRRNGLHHGTDLYGMRFVSRPGLAAVPHEFPAQPRFHNSIAITACVLEIFASDAYPPLDACRIHTVGLDVECDYSSRLLEIVGDGQIPGITRI